MSTQTQRNTVVGVFHDRTQAQQAVAELRREGFSDDQLGIVARDEDGDVVNVDENADNGDSYAGEGALAGAAAGAGIGALWGLGIVAGLLPAIGPAIAGGTLAAILASAATGAAAAGLAGALIGLGIPKEEAEYYEGELRAGRTIVTVQAGDRYDEAAAILRRYDSYDYASAAGRNLEASDTWSSNVAAGSETRMEGETIRAHEEELRVRKQPVETGEVNIRKEVHTEQRTLEVPVTREEVIVERHTPSGHEASGAHVGEIGEGDEIRIPVVEEQVHIEKRPVVTEEVQVRKQRSQGTESVTGQVRKEEIHVDKEGDVDIRNA